MSVYKHGWGIIHHPAIQWVKSTAHQPAPKHLTRPPKLDAYKPTYQPQYERPARQWVSGQITAATTVATRREWFRIMQWNIMTDSLTLRTPPPPRSARNVEELEAMQRGEIAVEQEPPMRATAVANIRTPLTRADVEWEHRACRIVDEVLFQDPDLLVLNEVNRANFDQTLWRMLRSQGYGALYVSSRLDRALKSPMDNPQARDVKNPHLGKLRYEEDVGNAIFYHKGRFFPLLMPGSETPKSIPYLNITGLRDRVTNLTTLVVAVQFTAGDGPAAVAARELEARGTLRVLEAVQRNAVERGFAGTIIAGDFNNSDYDEPCVNIFQDKYSSAMDLIGGARWTTWYRTHVDQPWSEQRHLHPEWQKRNHDAHELEARAVQERVQAVLKKRAERKRIAEGSNNSSGGAPTTDDAGAAATIAASSSSAEDTKSNNEPATADSATTTAAAAAPAAAVAADDAAEDAPIVAPQRFRRGSNSGPVMSSSATTNDNADANNKLNNNDSVAAVPNGLEAIRALAEREKADALALRAKGIVKRTSDFIFFDDSMLTTLRVLDTPADAEVDENVLLPDHRVPSHHVPLVVDMCWNTFAPPETSREKGENK